MVRWQEGGLSARLSGDMKDQKAKALRKTDAVKTPQQLEWKKRFQWTLFVLMLCVLLAIIGSIFYRYTGGTYTPTDAYRDLGFTVGNENVNTAVVNDNASVGVDGAVNANTNASTNLNTAVN